MRRFHYLLLTLALAFSGITGAFAQDLFEEAGHAIGHSRWVLVRFMPAIEIALEADDIVLVQSIEHPAKGFAMRIDGKAFAGDCEVTESKDTEFTVAQDSKKNWSTASTSTSTTYWSECELPKGTSDKAVSAHQIVVQLAMTNGSTKPHTLNSKELRKFQRLEK